MIENASQVAPPPAPHIEGTPWGPAGQSGPADPAPVPAGGPARTRAVATFLALAGFGVWATWSALAEMQARWATDPTYSHGHLVPLIALVILWARRGLAPAAPKPHWAGVGLVALGVALQVVGAYLYIRWLIGAALVLYLGGAAVLAGGRAALRWAAPAIGFLIFMFPWPYRFEAMMRQPLQRISTRASCFAMQTLGLPAVPEGNIIALDDVELGVVDACSGLKMFIVFFGTATAVALLAWRHPVGRAVIVLSAVPIAIICNVARITATGVLHETAGERWANLVFHDLAGWLMMPLALLLLWCELKWLGALIAERGEAPAPLVAPVPVAAAAAPRRAGAGPTLTDRHPDLLG